MRQIREKSSDKAKGNYYRTWDIGRLTFDSEESGSMRMSNVKRPMSHVRSLGARPDLSLLLEASHLRREEQGHPAPTRILVKDRRTTQVILKRALLVCRLADIQQHTARPGS